MEGLVADTGWRVARFLEGEDGVYAAVIDKT
jgi:hypothetical protein